MKPESGTFARWIEAFVPEKDLFFLTENELGNLEEYLDHVLVIPKEEFSANATYNGIQWQNSYTYWNLSEEAATVIVAPPDWVGRLPDGKRRQLLHSQKEAGSGLVYEISHDRVDGSIPAGQLLESGGEQFIILQKAMWEELGYEVKRELISEFAQQWEEWTCYEHSLESHPHLQKYANVFPSSGGANCLAATLFAVTREEWIINEWVHQKTFSLGLKRAHYGHVVNSEIRDGDVVTWENEEGIIQHASFCVGDDKFFNKSGQTFFNAWKIVDWTELEEMWESYRVKVFRKEDAIK
ncbi:hypothetical protein ACQ0QQ_16825 [Lysinibacillus sphaericus]